MSAAHDPLTRRGHPRHHDVDQHGVVFPLPRTLLAPVARRAPFLLAVAAVIMLAGCAHQPETRVVTVTACPTVDAALFAAGDLPDGLPSDPAEAVLALWRAWAERGAALAAIRRQLEAD